MEFSEVIDHIVRTERGELSAVVELTWYRALSFLMDEYEYRLKQAAEDGRTVTLVGFTIEFEDNEKIDKEFNFELGSHVCYEDILFAVTDYFEQYVLTDKPMGHLYYRFESEKTEIIE